MLHLRAPHHAAHRRLDVPDWFVSHLMLDRAMDAILRRITLDRQHDIPYLAGYSLDGKTIYLDRRLPTELRIGERMIPTDRYLILHEAVEKSLIDALGLHYQHAHQIALRVEQAAVAADGIPWEPYDLAMQAHIREGSMEPLERIPVDLDRKPYRDEHDLDLLRRMDQALVPGGVPAHPGAAILAPERPRPSLPPGPPPWEHGDLD